MKKIVSMAIALCLLVLFTACGESAAKKAFNESLSALEEKNAELDSAITSAQEQLDSEKVPYQESTKTELQTAIANAREAKTEAPEMPKGDEGISAETEKLHAVDYSEQMSKLQTAKENYENSVKQLAQVTNPTGDFVIQRLTEIEAVTDILGVTEENDPNGKLNKPGGYTSTTYFTSSLVKESVSGKDAIKKGTDAGGSVEVYQTVEDADKRDSYLSNFDGNGILDPGSHTVCGTMVIRTSTHLTATQQKELTKLIENKLLELR